MNSGLRFYDRTLSRLSRRELLNVAWKLGAAAIAAPLASARVLGAADVPRLSVHAGRGVGRSVPTGRGAVDAAGARAARGRRHADGQRRGRVGDRRASGVPHDRAEGRRRWRGPSSGTASTSRSAACSRAASTSTASLRPRGQPDRAARRPRRPGRRRSISCGSACAGAATTRPATSPPTAGSPRSSSTSSSTPATTSTRAATTAGATRSRAAPHHGQEIYTLVDYRNRYAQYKSDPDFMAAHASAPFIVTWDDHEVDNDYAGDRDENDTPPEVFLLRRAAAYQAYYETMPLRASAMPTGPRDAAVSAAAVRQPDRLERARHAAVPIESGLRRRRRRTDCAEALDPARTHPRRRAGEVAVRQPRDATRRWTRAGAAGADRSRATTTASTRRAASPWTSGTATSRAASGCSRG